MSPEQVTLTVPGQIKYCHFISDACELLVRSKISFYSEEYYTCFIQDLRIVIYELFSNAVNHSKSDKVSIILTVDDEFLIMDVQTNNIGFGVKEIEPDNAEAELTAAYPPFPETLVNKDVLVYRDSGVDILCKVTGQNSAVLTRHKNFVRGGASGEHPEHYGLNLITRLTHECSYYRDEAGFDNFVVKKRIK